MNREAYGSCSRDIPKSKWKQRNIWEMRRNSSWAEIREEIEQDKQRIRADCVDTLLGYIHKQVYFVYERQHAHRDNHK